MKIFKMFISIIFLSCISIKYSFAEDCSKFEKLSKGYAKCNAELFKKNAEKYGFKKKDAIIFKIGQISPLKDIIN